MASIYKRAARVAADEDMSDDSMTDASSSTVRAESDESEDSSNSDNENEEKKTSTRLSDVPTELRNRILMLTSRGVSYRYVILQFLFHFTPTDNSLCQTPSSSD